MTQLRHCFRRWHDMCAPASHVVLLCLIDARRLPAEASWRLAISARLLERPRISSVLLNSGNTGVRRKNVCVTQRTGAAARESLWRDCPGGLTAPAFHACDSASPFRARSAVVTIAQNHTSATPIFDASSASARTICVYTLLLCLSGG